MRALIGSRRSEVGGRKSGSVLILALWVLFFLAALALAVGAHVSAGLKLAGFMREDVHGYHLARAAVTHAALQVACNTNQWDASVEDAWNSDPEVFSDQTIDGVGTFSIFHMRQTPGGMEPADGLVGAESRLNLNHADELIFKQFMIQVGGLSAAQAETLYKSLQTYREAKQQQLLTIRAARGYVEPNSGGEAPLESIYEFLLVDGVDDGLFALVEPYVTIYGSGKINANTASAELLLSCAEAYSAAKEGIATIMVEREAGTVATSPSELFSRFKIDFLTVESTAFYGTAVGHTVAGDETARIEFVVDSSGQRQYWHEF